MSFGKMMALFGGFIAVVMVLAVVVLMMMNSGQKPAPVVTKKYNQPQPQQRVAPKQARENAVGTVISPDAHNEQAALQQAALRAQGAQGAQVPADAKAAPTPSQVASGPMLTSEPQTGKASQPAAQQAAATADTAARLATMESKLNQIAARLDAYESKPQKKVAQTAKGGGREKAAGTSRTARVAAPTQPAQAQIVDSPAAKQPRELTGYKSMAVVGNRAWIQLPDGAEQSVAAGDAVPAPRARIRAVDSANGVVITSSDERIEH